MVDVERPASWERSVGLVFVSPARQAPIVPSHRSVTKVQSSVAPVNLMSTVVGLPASKMDVPNVIRIVIAIHQKDFPATQVIVSVQQGKQTALVSVLIY